MLTQDSRTKNYKLYKVKVVHKYENSYKKLWFGLRRSKKKYFQKGESVQGHFQYYVVFRVDAACLLEKSANNLDDTWLNRMIEFA